MSFPPHVKNALQALVRFCAPVQFGDMTRTAPISSTFGLERGTPIDRYYIEQFINANRDVISGRCLEVGEIRYLREFGMSATQRCVLAPAQEAAEHSDDLDSTIIGDLTNCASLPESRFDCFVCTQTLNFIYDVRAAIRGAHHLLAGGGIFIGSVSGISQISRYDMDRWGDYWRFTTRSLERLIGEAFGSVITVESFGNASAAQFALQGVAVEDLPDCAVLDFRDPDYQVIIGFHAQKI